MHLITDIYLSPSLANRFISPASQWSGRGDSTEQISCPTSLLRSQSSSERNSKWKVPQDFLWSGEICSGRWIGITETDAYGSSLAVFDPFILSRCLDEGDLAELRSLSVSNDLDPSQFFRNELAQAIREIRNDYENRVDGQRSEMQNRYALLVNELAIKQQGPGANALQSDPQRRQQELSRTQLLQTQNQNAHLKAQNEDVRNRLAELERKLNDLKQKGGLAQAKAAKDIEEAKRRLDQANHDFGEVSNMKTSLEKEISTYRDLLESKQTSLWTSFFTNYCCCSHP